MWSNFVTREWSSWARTMFCCGVSSCESSLVTGKAVLIDAASSDVDVSIAVPGTSSLFRFVVSAMGTTLADSEPCCTCVEQAAADPVS